MEKQEQSAYQVVMENGHYGLIGKEDDYVIPPVYDEIMIDGNTAKCRVFRDWDYFDYVKGDFLGNIQMELTTGQPTDDSSLPFGCFQDGSFDRSRFDKQMRVWGYGCYVICDGRTGKLGVKDYKSHWVLPCKFDFVCKWKDCEVIFTRIGTTFSYYDMHGKQILPTVKYGKGEEDPYGCNGNGSILMTRQLTDDADDPQSCICYGRRVHLEQMLYKDLIDGLESHCEYSQIPEGYLKTMKSKEARDHTLFIAKSSSDKPIADCDKQLIEMRRHLHSWAENVTKVWTNSRTQLPQREMNRLRYMLAYSREVPYFAYGIDDTLADGEVKLWQISFYKEDWGDGQGMSYFLDTCCGKNLDEIKTEMKCQEMIPYQEELHMPIPCPWAQAEVFLNYMIACGIRTKFFVYDCVYNIVSYPKGRENYERVQFAYHCLEWALNKGLYTQYLGFDGMPLDILLQAMKENAGKIQKHNLKYWEGALQLLLSHHAMTREQMMRLKE